MHSNRSCVILVQWTLRSSSTMSCTTCVREVKRTRMTAQCCFQTLPKKSILSPRRWRKCVDGLSRRSHHRCDESDVDDCKFFVNFDMAVLGWGTGCLCPIRAGCARGVPCARRSEGGLLGRPQRAEDSTKCGCHHDHHPERPESVSCARQRGRPWSGRRPVFSVPQSVSPSHSLLFTLYPSRYIAYFLVLTHQPLLLILSFLTPCSSPFTLHFLHLFTSPLLHSFALPGSQLERALRSARDRPIRRQNENIGTDRFFQSRNMSRTAQTSTLALPEDVMVVGVGRFARDHCQVKRFCNRQHRHKW